MMLTDPLGDMLSRIKNGYMARKSDVEIPYSGVKEALAKILQRKKFISGIEIEKNKKFFTVKLVYDQNKPAISEISRVSKPGLRQYIKAHELTKFQSGLGFYILSTPKGLKTHIEAKREKIGGEIICRVW